MNLLFVCKHNRFRSKVAEALFRHYYKGDSIFTKGAGLAVDITRPYVARSIMNIMKEKGVSMRDDGAKKIDDFVLKWADRIIIVADNVSPSMFYGKEFLVGKPIVLWGISDASENEPVMVRRRIDEIEKRVLELVKMFG